MSGSPTPSPSKPKWSSRMGGALRRTSTLLTIARPGTPGEDKDDSGSDTKSVRKSSSRGSLRSIKNALSPAAHAVSSPSPIAESPMREAAAQQTEVVGPSPLAKAATNSTTYEGSTEPAKVEEVPATSPEEQASPSGYVPPPVVSSTAGNPGAFTDDLDDLPQSQAVVDPYATPADVAPVAESAPTAPASEEPVKPVEEAPPQAPAIEPSTSYFDKPIAESMTSADSPQPHHTVVTPEFAEVAQVIPDPVAPVAVETTESTSQQGEAASYYRGDPDAPVPEPHHDEPEHTAPVAQPQPQPQAQTERSAAPTAPTFGAVMPSYDLPSYNVWAGSNPAAAVPVMPVPVAADPNDHHSEVSSLKLPNPHAATYDDPFADPPAGPGLVVMPTAQIHAPEVTHQHQQAPVETREQAHPVIVMPLPAFDDVVARNASTRTLTGSRIPPETNERMPLLARPTTPKYLSTNVGSTYATTSVSPIVGSSSMYTNGHTRPRLIDLGWVEYTLPDGLTYYSHLTRKITTDLDLRRDRILTAVTLWMDDRENESMNIDLEGWLRRASTKSKKGGWGSSKGKKDEEPIVLERYWVDHHHRSVEKEDTGDRRFVGYGRNHGHTNGNGHGHSGKGKDKKPVKVQEDQLDLEYRYWSFMESHPAHLPVSHKAKAEALDVLTWALTDQILPSNSTVPPPFGQDECQELRSVLTSFTRESEHGDNGIQTRIISRILLRVAQWRQTYFRPNKPLPLDIGSRYPSLPTQRRPFRRAVFDFLVSCLCLGIPYFFMERARLAGSRGADEESGLFRGPTPMLIVGAFACIVAAIILSASVTFLSLPGLDGVTRTAGMVAILFAAFAMAATGVAILRHKADLERSVSRIGVEGLVGISRRTIVLSLPLVFLAYSIIAFIAGMTLYSFRGKTFDDKLPRNAFEDYTRWTVVGVLGGLLGIVTTSLLFLRR